MLRCFLNVYLTIHAFDLHSPIFSSESKAEKSASMFPNGDASISIEKEQEKFTSYSTMDEKVWQLINKRYFNS